MKNKITISLEGSILEKIDATVESGEGKNRSAVIESVLKERYGDFVDVCVIILAHDRKWDNRAYPFSKPKPLLEVRGRSVIDRQVEIFTKPWIKNVIITIENDSTEFFKKELLEKYPDIDFTFIEMDHEYQTGTALKIALKEENTDKTLLIANGDNFYGNFDVAQYFKYHKEQGSDFSMMLKFVLNAEQLWNVAIHGNKIIWFVDKWRANQTYLTNSGLYITTRKFLNKKDFWEYLEQDYFPMLMEENDVTGYIYQNEWEHIQNDSAYERVNGWLM